MSTVCLYRKWRSRTFEDLVGQDHVTTTLQRAVLEGRLAHAYLFAGPRGTGKTSTAKLLAKVLNCANRGSGQAEPCNDCSMCRQINGGHAIDIIEIDAASNRGIDEIRDLREKIKFAPTEAQYKVYIVDEVHMLTPEASNALLLTLEEPPPRTVFVLATTEPHKLLPTVLSRCQRFDFKRLSVDTIEERLDVVARAEGFAIAPRARAALARAAAGSLRDAISLLDQVVAFAGREVSEEGVAQVLGMSSRDLMFRAGAAVAGRDARALLLLLDEAVARGGDLAQLVGELLAHYRDLLLLKVAGEETPLVRGAPEDRERLLAQAREGSVEAFSRAVKVLGEVKNELRWNENGRIAVEMGLLRLVLWSADPSGESLRQRLVQCEERLHRLEIRFPEAEEPKARPVQRSSSRKPAPAESPPSSSPLSFEEIVARWPGFLELVKQEKRNLHAVLVEGVPTVWEAGVLTVGFPAQFAFHKETVESQRGFLGSLFARSFGVPGELRPVFTDAASRQETGAPAQESPEDRVSAHDTAVRGVLEMFGGTVVGGGNRGSAGEGKNNVKGGMNT